MTRPLVLLFAVALVPRLAVLFTGPWAEPTRVYAHSPDSPRYVALADTLLSHRTFGKPSEDGLMHLAVEKLRRDNGTLPPPDANGLYSEAFRTPGYPLFLATFGGTRGLPVAYLVQCLLGAFSALCLVRIALALGCRPRAALVAGWLWALHPAAITSDVLPLTESLFCSLALVGLAAAAQTTTPAGRVWSGLFIGLTALVRPLGLLYLPTALVLGWRTSSARPRSRKWLAAGVAVLVAVVPSVAWAARNAAAGSGPRVSTVGELNLYYYGAAYVISEDRGDDWFTSWPARVDELTQRLAAKLQPGQDVFALARKEALAEFRTRPATTAKVAVKSEVKLCVDHSAGLAAALYGVEYRPSGFFSDVLRGQLDTSKLSVWALVALPWTALNGLVALLAAVGLVRCAIRRRWALVFACLIPVVLFSAATFPVGLERFRLPFMPFLFVLAACALWAPERPTAPPHTTAAP
ncbi:MAG: glycosyltransferase family 39 protein [Planctomycetes bacterium]|nr:glycosyltransferase family 39 protein [Planctomycetota bacterium]